jgi:TonB family protein
MNNSPYGRFVALQTCAVLNVQAVLFTCMMAALALPAHGQLAWFRSDKKGGVPVGNGTNVRLFVPAGEKATFYTSGFPPITLNAPGVTATVALNVTFEGDLPGLAANNIRFFGLGLFNDHGTSPGNTFSDDSGYFFTIKSISTDSGFIELRKRLGNGKSPYLNPSSEARANIGGSKDVQSPGTVIEKTPYQIVFRLARNAGGISFGSGRGLSSAGVSFVGGGLSITTYSSEPDANPESTTFNEFGIFVENRSSTDAYIGIDSLQLELRKDGQLLTVTTRPSITTQPKDIVAPAGKKAVLNVEATGGALAYQWKKNKVNISGAVGDSYAVEEAELDDGGVYSVVVSNPYGDVESSPANIRIKQLVTLKPGTEAVEQIVYDEDAVEVKPVFRRMPRIHYPKSLKAGDVKGVSVLRFIVTSEGYVDSIQVSKYADHELIEPLMAAYQKARYKPALKNGLPVSTRVSVTVPYPPEK